MNKRLLLGGCLVLIVVFVSGCISQSPTQPNCVGAATPMNTQPDRVGTATVLEPMATVPPVEIGPG